VTVSDDLNQNPSIDGSGKAIVFTSKGGDSFGANDFGSTPICEDCNNADANGELFIWRQKIKNGHAANSIQQITDTTGGGTTANQFPDFAQKGNYVAWDSDRDLTGDNADGNREIFLYDVRNETITQVTNTTSNGDTANRNVSSSDDGVSLTFDSTRDYASANCTLADGLSPCDNADSNSEVMVYDRNLNKFTQVTKTTGGGTQASVRSRISADGKFLGFQSSRDFGAALDGGATCTMADRITACDNADGNGDVVRFDRKNNAFTQVTNTTSCGGMTANERVEISKGGKYISWQSTCESQLNPTGCGSCDDHDEAFMFDAGKKRIHQVTISDASFNRVPRIAGKGGYLVLESTRNYNNLNPTHKRVLYILKRNTAPEKDGISGPGQLIDDPGSPLTQSVKTQLVTINFAGGFNSGVEQFGVSGNGKYIAFDNNHDGSSPGNHELWWLDRTK